MKPLQIGLLGLGTVGGSTYQVLQRNKAQIQRRLGRSVLITMVADLDVVKAKSLVDADCQVVSDARCGYDHHPGRGTSPVLRLHAAQNSG